MRIAETLYNASRDCEHGPIMDKFWSICTFPIGILICFGPALVAWLIEELKTPQSDNRDEPK